METQASNSKASKSLVRTKQRSKRDQRAEVRAIMLQRARTPTTWLKLWWLSRVLRPPLVLVYIQNILSVSFFSRLSPSNIPISSSLPPQFLYLVHTLSLSNISPSLSLSLSLPLISLPIWEIFLMLFPFSFLFCFILYTYYILHFWPFSFLFVCFIWWDCLLLFCVLCELSSISGTSFAFLSLPYIHWILYHKK